MAFRPSHTFPVSRDRRKKYRRCLSSFCGIFVSLLTAFAVWLLIQFAVFRRVRLHAFCNADGGKPRSRANA